MAAVVTKDVLADEIDRQRHHDESEKQETELTNKLCSYTSYMMPHNICNMKAFILPPDRLFSKVLEEEYSEGLSLSI